MAEHVTDNAPLQFPFYTHPSPNVLLPRRAFRDSCPHRLAPLSEGRVDKETGNLSCNYHGEFAAVPAGAPKSSG